MSCSLLLLSNHYSFTLRPKSETRSWTRKSLTDPMASIVSNIVSQTRGLWIAYPGVQWSESESIPESEDTKDPQLLSSFLAPIRLEQKDYDLHYKGCCKSILKPLLFESSNSNSVFQEEPWEAYKRVNEVFARKTLQILQQNSDQKTLIWIHDFHLLLTGKFIREMAKEKNHRVRIGLFLHHVSFPSWRRFKAFPKAEFLLQSMMRADLIGFSTEEHIFSFLHLCHQVLGCRIHLGKKLIEHGGRTIQIRSYSLGLKTPRFSLINETFDCQILLSIEEDDDKNETKGCQTLCAFESLLRLHPALRQKVTLHQIVISKSLRERTDLEKIVQRINEEFSINSWSPLTHQILDSDSALQVVKGLRHVTMCHLNLRDEALYTWIPLVSGLPILHFSSDIATMMPGALIVNSLDSQDLTNCFLRALRMSKEEKESREAFLRFQYDENKDWFSHFIECLKNENLETLLPESLEDFDSDLNYFFPKNSSKSVSLLLDYDGTLAPLASHPDKAVLPSETKRILERLSKLPNIFISIISGRSVENVRSMVGLSGLTYAGNHGLQIIHSDGSTFLHPSFRSREGEDDIKALALELQTEVCVEGAWVENKDILLTYHYRNTPYESRAHLLKRASSIILKHGFVIGEAHCALEIKPPVNWNKGSVSHYILKKAFGDDWFTRTRVIFAGDDTTDEDAFLALKGLARTFRIVGNSSITLTAADRRLTSVESVFTLLQWIEKHSQSE